MSKMSGYQVFITLKKSTSDEAYGFFLSTTVAKTHVARDIQKLGIAERSGLEDGDFIIKINGVLIHEKLSNQEALLLAKKNPLEMELLVLKQSSEKYHQNYDGYSLSSGVSSQSAESTSHETKVTSAAQNKMNFFKKIIMGKKTDRRFKKSDTGYSLADDAPIRPQQQPSGSSYAVGYQLPPVTAQRVAISNSTAEAATRRLQEANGGKTETAHQKKIRELARKQLKEEMEAERRQLEGITIGERDVKEFEHSSAIEGIYFMCDLFEDDIFLSKSQMVEQVEAFLRTKLSEEGAQVASIMIHSLNDMEKRDNAISTLNRILKNIINNPTEEKYRRIKMTGKVFNETVKPVKGAIEFLKSLGFKEELENNETFLLLSSIADERRAEISLALEILTSEDCRVTLRLYRNPKIYKINPNQPLPKIEVPKDFLTVSGSKMKAEQQHRAQEVDRITELRTREMRQKDAQAWKYTYKYTLIQIRFPNSYILEGTFGVHENLAVLREFVSEHLGTEFGVFHLADPAHGELTLDDDQKSLADYRLVPAAILMFHWHDETISRFASLNMQVKYLSPESEKNAVPLE